MSAHSTADGALANLSWLARVPIDPMTYRSLGYLLLTMPLAIAYFAVLVAGFSLSLSMLVLLVGPLVFAATLLAVVAFAWFDGLLTEVILDAEVSYGFPSDESLKTFARELFLGRETWLGFLFLLWKMFLGLGAFTLLVAGFSLGLGLLFTPFYYGEHVVLYYGTGTVIVDTLREAVAMAGLGIVITYATLLLVNLLGILSREIAEGMLSEPSSA